MPAPACCWRCCPPCSAASTCCRAFSPSVRTRFGCLRSSCAPIVQCYTAIEDWGTAKQQHTASFSCTSVAIRTIVKPVKQSGINIAKQVTFRTAAETSCQPSQPAALSPMHCCLAVALPATSSASVLHAACDMKDREAQRTLHAKVNEGSHMHLLGMGPQAQSHPVYLQHRSVMLS